MEAIEFETNINDGIIKIPKEYYIKTKESIKVIVLYENSEKIERNNGIIDRLLENPIKFNSFKPLKREEIYE